MCRDLNSYLTPQLCTPSGQAVLTQVAWRAAVEGRTLGLPHPRKLAGAYPQTVRQLPHTPTRREKEVSSACSRRWEPPFPCQGEAGGQSLARAPLPHPVHLQTTKLGIQEPQATHRGRFFHWNSRQMTLPSRKPGCQWLTARSSRLQPFPYQPSAQPHARDGGQRS